MPGVICEGCGRPGRTSPCPECARGGSVATAVEVAGQQVFGVEGRRLAERLAPFVERSRGKRRIVSHGTDYLDRFFLGGWRPEQGIENVPGVFLHRFLASDPRGEVHSHPWSWSVSLILAGGYREERCGADGQTTVREFLPGDVNVLGRDERHRIELLEDDCWTLFLTSSYAKEWGFYESC